MFSVVKNHINYPLNNSFKGVVEELWALAFFFVPFLKFSPVASGVITLCALISMVAFFLKKGAWGTIRFNPLSLLILAFMLYTILSSWLIVQEMRPFVRLVFEIRLPMLLLSLAYLFRDTATFNMRRALGAFALGAFASFWVVFVIFVHSLITSFDNISYSFFNLQLCFNSVISLITHRTYLCFNLITALIICYYLFSKSWTREKVVCFTIITLSIAIIVFLSDARISLITFLWVMFFVVSREMKRYWGVRKSFLFTVLVLTLFIFVLTQSNRINNMMLSILHDSVALRELDPRFFIWECGWNCYAASQHPWVGTGAGSAADILMAEYQRVDFYQAISSHWGTHNQFLEVLLEHGVVGLLLLIAALLFPLFIKGDLRLLYWIWIPALCLNLFFESMLSRSIGTYPIMTLWILAGIADEKGENQSLSLPLFRKVFWVITLIIVMIASVRYLSMDRKKLFSQFQRGFERVDDLPGDLPDEIVGYYGLKIDSTVTCDTWREWAMMYHRLDEKKLKESDSLSFTLYFYASEDFSADELSIRIEERKQKSREVYYDLSQKGTWQKLDISGRGIYGNTLFLVYCRKNHAKDFSDVDGFAIFTKPEIKIIK